ncbi:hypothetical protein B0H14DRAFT_3692864, partial [Mycena olivaceomarginata]
LRRFRGVHILLLLVPLLVLLVPLLVLLVPLLVLLVLIFLVFLLILVLLMIVLFFLLFILTAAILPSLQFLWLLLSLFAGALWHGGGRHGFRRGSCTARHCQFDAFWLWLWSRSLGAGRCSETTSRALGSPRLSHWGSLERERLERASER